MSRYPRADGEYFDELEVSPPEQLERQRWQRISRVLNYAARGLPFYRERFRAAGWRPGAVAGPEQFAARVPRFRKADLIEAISRGGRAEAGIEAIGRQRVSNIVMTSGTLGFNTFGFLTASDLRRGNILAVLRDLWMVKVRPGMRVLTLSPGWHLLALLDSLALSRIGAIPVCPWGTFVPRFTPNFLDAVQRLRPEHMLVTAPVLRAMLAECQRLGRSSRDVFASVRYVACGGEALSPPFRQAVIEAMGLQDFFERGGSSDGMFGGGECFAHRGHHIFADLHYIEIIDPRTGALLPPGRRGSAVVTNLTLGRSLYIRFDTEDLAEVKEGACPCGRSHPVVELYGRLADCVLFDDRIVAPYDVRCVIDSLPELRSEPFTAEALPGGQGLAVTLSRSNPASEAVLAELSDRLQRQLLLPVVVASSEPRETGWKGQVMRGEGRGA